MLDGSISEDEVREILHLICLAVENAGGHRDIKLESVLISTVNGKPTIHLTNFGF